MTSEIPNFKLSELYLFLMTNLPSVYTLKGDLNTKKLADDLGYTRWHLYRHIGTNRLPVKLADALITLSRETPEAQKKDLITPELIVRFVLKR